MFRVDRTANRISRLEKQRFTDLGLRERSHLQEWIVHQPDALGEDLLILQKEFQGFAETPERLDLLALDKDGCLVVIENKLDDSGRDVTWQALKYTAYISTLKTEQIVNIFQQYLSASGESSSASERICEFLEIEELEEAQLNPINSHRIILIAANFRREVTATVMWLISRGIAIQCFRVMMFSFEKELFLDMQLFLPPPEAKGYMISISSKEVAEAVTEKTRARRHDLRLQFWAKALERLSEDGIDLYANVNPTQDHWLSAGSGVGSCPFQMIFGHNEVRVQLCLGRSAGAENKQLFDQLLAQKFEIEKTFGYPLDWRRMDDKKQSRIVYARNYDGYDKEIWVDMVKWLSTHMKALTAAIQEPLREADRSLPF